MSVAGYINMQHVHLIDSIYTLYDHLVLSKPAGLNWTETETIETQSNTSIIVLGETDHLNIRFHMTCSASKIKGTSTNIPKLNSKTEFLVNLSISYQLAMRNVRNASFAACGGIQLLKFKN